MELSGLCPVTVLICLASVLWSESTVTYVARTQWLVRWGAIPVDVDMFFIMFSSVILPTGELQYNTSSFCGWSFVDTSLGRWNRACRLGFRCLKEAFKGFHRAALWIRNLNHFTVGFVRVIHLDDFWMQSGCETHSNVALEVYQHVLGELSLIFTSPLTEIKGYIKPCSAEELRRIQGIPLTELPCFVQLL